MFFALNLLLLFSNVYSWSLLEQACSDIEPLQSFDFDILLGTWYGAEASVDTRFRADCHIHNYTKTENNYRMTKTICFRRFNMTTFEFDGPCNKLMIREFVLHPEYSVGSPITDNSNTNDFVEYWRRKSPKLLGSDNSTFIIWYQCTDIDEDLSTVDVEVYTRDVDPSPSTLESVYQVLEPIGINRTSMRKISHSVCGQDERYEARPLEMSTGEPELSV